MADERMSEEEIAQYERTFSAFCVVDGDLAQHLLAELRRERARADEATRNIRAVRDLVGALDGEETFDAVRAFVHERDQLRRDRERERDIAARRERAACVSHVRQRGVESKDGMVLDVTTDIANEIEEGLHHG